MPITKLTLQNFIFLPKREKIGKLSIILLLGCLLFSLGSCSSPDQSQLKTKPNIVLIFADDMTYSAINALGNKEINTPNLDKLVNGGTTFTNCYNMGGWNGAICMASRAMMISGRHLWRANDFQKNWSKTDSTYYQQSWGKLMEHAGYDTYMSGKWHVSAPADKVFQTARHIRPGMPEDAWKHANMGQKFREVVGKVKVDGRLVTAEDIMPVGYSRPKNENDHSWSPTDPKFGGFWEGGKHWSEVLKDDALDYMELAKNKENPFFMYLAFNAPHDPRQAPQSFIDQYPLEKISVPPSYLPEYPWKDSIGNSASLRDEALAPYPRTKFAVKKHIQEYYAIITHMDEQIGKILAAIEDSGKADNTYIFFTADHGLSVGKHGLIGKQSMYDHSMRPPLMVKGPGIPQGKKVSANVYLQDIMATALAIADIPKPEYVEFNNLLPLINGSTTQSQYPSIYGAYVDLQRMIRKDGFKLVVYPKIKKLLLFDLQKDPAEINDLASDPAYEGKVENLFKELVALQKEMDDALDLEAIFN